MGVVDAGTSARSHWQWALVSTAGSLVVAVVEVYRKTGEGFSGCKSLVRSERRLGR